jgi:hypothetical protein
LHLKAPRFDLHRQVFQRQQRGLGLTPREIADRWAKLKSEIAEMQASGREGL